MRLTTKKERETNFKKDTLPSRNPTSSYDEETTATMCSPADKANIYNEGITKGMRAYSLFCFFFEWYCFYLAFSSEK